MLKNALKVIYFKWFWSNVGMDYLIITVITMIFCYFCLIAYSAMYKIIHNSKRKAQNGLKAWFAWHSLTIAVILHPLMTSQLQKEAEICLFKVRVWPNLGLGPLWAKSKNFSQGPPTNFVRIDILKKFWPPKNMPSEMHTQP